MKLLLATSRNSVTPATVRSPVSVATKLEEGDILYLDIKDQDRVVWWSENGIIDHQEANEGMDQHIDIFV